MCLDCLLLQEVPPEVLALVLMLALIWGLTEVGLARGPLFWLGVGGSLLPLDPALAGLSRWIGSGGLAALMIIFGWGLHDLCSFFGTW